MILFMTVALATADASAAPATPPEEKKICKTVEKTGSRLGGEKICHTAAEWQRMQDGAQDEFRRMNRPTVNPY